MIIKKRKNFIYHNIFSFIVYIKKILNNCHFLTYSILSSYKNPAIVMHQAQTKNKLFLKMMLGSSIFSNNDGMWNVFVKQKLQNIF